ncbi:MAG: peptide deformylase [Pseudomonadota bacterium]
MFRPFLRYPHPCLRTAARRVDTVDQGVRDLWDEMLAAMYAMPGHGVGLAAPQLGESRRLAVLDCSDSRDQPIRLANPELTWASEALQAYTEASPNMPGVSAEISRPAEVEVRYLDKGGQEVSRRFDGLWAVSVQHQLDHLDGRMFVDRLGPVKRQRLLSSFRKLDKKGKR